MALNQVGLERLNTATTKKIGTNKNLVVNGAMLVAQRGTSSTDDGYGSVDRFRVTRSGTDENPTQAQVDVASGTTPYTLGFRKAFKITNGNQTSGAGADDTLQFQYRAEDQDFATSGWNYTSASSYVTMSFWCKSSIAQNFYFNWQSNNGSQYRYVMETGSLSADTWTKVTKTIPGNSNIVLNNDNGVGFYISWHLFDGTNRTGTRPLNAWAAIDNANRTPDQTSTWYTTNDSTFEITGLQIEVGSVATDFEHRSFAQELALCQRYFYQHLIGASKPVMNFVGFSSTGMYGAFQLPQEMRANPSIVQTTGTNYYSAYHQAGQVENFDGFNSIVWSGKRTIIVDAQTAQNLSIGTNQGLWAVSQNASAKLAFNAEM